MKRLLLAATFLAAFPLAQAHAACTLTPDGTIQWISNCSADNQANDGDDIKMFVDRTPQTTADLFGSLGSNNQLFDNIEAKANGDFETDGSGFANFKSVDAGSPLNTLTAYGFTPGPTGTLPNGAKFNGFDGQLFRGQIDNTGGFTGDLDVLVTFSNGTTASHTFTGLSDKKDFGVLGFDEIAEPGLFVKSVLVSLVSEHGAFNEFKQIEFSVPGQVATIPEPSTWAMLIVGFGLMGLFGWRKARGSSSMGLGAWR